MIEDPFCSSGRKSSPEAGRGAGAHQREVRWRSCVSETATTLSSARQLDERVAVALGLERVLGREDVEPRAVGQQRRDALGESGMGVQAVPVAVPPCGNLADLRQPGVAHASRAERTCAA
jgi:hypothetical protein